MGIHRRVIQQSSHNLPSLTKVIPLGSNGAGVWTAHPIGLVIVIGLLLVGFVGLPEARWFFALAVPAGAVCGLCFRLLHRNGFERS
jgi:hypothetical protein